MKKLIRVAKKVANSLSKVRFPNRLENEVFNMLSCCIESVNKEPEVACNYLTSYELFKNNFYLSRNRIFLNRITYCHSDLSFILDLNFGRFGNRFNELMAFTQFGLALGLSRIYIQNDYDIFNFNSTYIRSSKEIPKSALRINCKDAKFFHHFIWAAQITGYKNYKETAKYLLREIMPSSSLPDLSPSQLVIHFRGGDIFDRVNPPVFRHQPPVSWYIKVIEMHKKRHLDISLVLVCEDNINPCIQKILEYASKHSITYRIQSSSLEDDYSWILAAKTLVPSGGTFTDPAINTSTCLERVYKFKDEHITGKYIKRGFWRATSEQIDLMKSLPLECVDLPNNFYESSCHQTYARTDYSTELILESIKKHGYLNLKDYYNSVRSSQENGNIGKMNIYINDIKPALAVMNSMN